MSRPYAHILNFFAVAILFLGLFGFLYADAGVLFRKRPAENLPVIGDAPVATMMNSQGETWSTESLRGKIWTFNFFFTSCEHVCPTIVRNIQDVQNGFTGNGEPFAVAISVEPETDTPEAMRAFVEKHALNTQRWQLLRAPIEDVKALSEKQLKVALGPEASLHSNRVFLIDRKGKIRGSYLALKKDEMARLAKDLVQVARES